MTTDDAGWKAINTQAVELVAEWQRRLRLMDWRIHVQVRRYYDMPSTVVDHGFEAAQITRHRHDKTAEIVILHPDDIDPETPGRPCLEQTIIHEMLHIHLIDWEPEPGSYDYFAMERAINLTADAFLFLRTDLEALRSVLPKGTEGE